jgi:hypothetical protein
MDDKNKNIIIKRLEKTAKDFIDGEAIFGFVRRNLRLVFLIIFLLLLYLANHKFSQDNFRKLTELERTLEIKRGEYLELQSINANKCKIKEVEKRIKEKTSKVPPKKIKYINNNN